MSNAKRVAIIGAGPSGLVMAKTLLHHFPPGTFHPVIFEKKNRIGGIWAVDYPSEESASDLTPDSRTRGRAFVSPWMRTNLSRFSVAFSDLSWETALGVEDVPAFPYAWEVRRYLEKYAGIYVPGEYLKLGARVLRTVRRQDGDGGAARWVVDWVDDETPIHNLNHPRVQTEDFHFLVVASGYFGTPSIPHIPGLANFPNTVHSSELQNPDDIRRLLDKSPKGGKLVVIGGSMSGVEAATSLALHLSSLDFSPGSQAQAGRDYEVCHVGPGPFWVLPTNLPHRYGNAPGEQSTMPFVPLDLFLYDLDRRPPGMKEMAFGPVSPDQISKRNQSFQDMLGKEYESGGGVNHTNNDGAEGQRPPWVGIADNYAEFIRSGAIKPLIGKASSVACSSPSHGTIDVQTPAGQTSPLTEVTAIVMATGFKPSDSLSFLPQDVLSTLEYSKEDHFLPLILEKWSSAHGEIPDLGFVGFYRGAFWGPAEMQAQSLSNTWAGIDPNMEKSGNFSTEELNSRAAERQKVRDYRDFRPTTLRGQFPLGDYVGLMELCSTRLDRGRVPLLKVPADTQPLGPVVPARYPPTISDDDGTYSLRAEVETTLNALNKTLLADSYHGSVGTTAAIFRALHGQWTFDRVVTTPSDHGERKDKSSGQATFHPRYPSGRNYQAEYLCEEVSDGNINTAIRSVYRHRDVSRFPKEAGIRILSVDEGTSPNSASRLVSELRVEPVAKVTDTGEFLIEATDSGDSPLSKHNYEFFLDRVAITKWCHTLDRVSGEGQEVDRCTTWYSRPDARHQDS
ncbi:hypothetical protein BDV12DRAFT_50983 [Aspergillus spectabilis]